jgi:hypothetical protein
MEHQRQFLIVVMGDLAHFFRNAGHKEKHERREGKAKKKSYRL